MKFLLLTLVSVFFCVINASFLTFVVDGKQSRCFYEDLSAGSQFEMNFEVLSGGLLDIKFVMTDPGRNVIIDRMAFFNRDATNSSGNEEEGKVQFKASTGGAYKFCFDNSISRWTPKTVSFEVFSKRANKQEAARLEHLGPMVDSVIKLSDDLDKIEKIQRFARSREKAHYDDVRSDNTKLQWMVVVSSFILLGLTALSIHNIQKWFSEEERRSGV